MSSARTKTTQALIAALIIIAGAIYAPDLYAEPMTNEDVRKYWNDYREALQHWNDDVTIIGVVDPMTFDTNHGQYTIAGLSAPPDDRLLEPGTFIDGVRQGWCTIAPGDSPVFGSAPYAWPWRSLYDRNNTSE